MLRTSASTMTQVSNAVVVLLGSHAYRAQPLTAPCFALCSCVQLHQSRRLATRALALWPDYWHAHYNLALTLIDMEEHEADDLAALHMHL